MLDIIYYFNIFGCLTMGMALLLIQTAPQLINPHYRNAKRFLGIASIIVALCNALIFYNRVQESVAEIFAMPVLVAAQLQAALFTFIVLILFHSPYVCRRNILRHLCPTLFFVGLYLLTILLFPDVRIYSVDEYIANITNPVLLLRTVFAATYLTQIVIYVRLFRREQRNYIAKIENYFSDTDKYEFRWASRLFYEAACIGIAVLVFSIFPAPLFDGIITLVITVYYFDFGVRYINYQYKLYYEALPAIEEKEESQPTKESEGDKELEDEMAKLLLYLQQGVVLGDYAEALHIPERKLSVFINSTYGVSFKRWVNNKRVEYATEQMAKHPDYTMERIAELSGFAHKSHFCKIFREITGGSFTEYKNR